MPSTQTVSLPCRPLFGPAYQYDNISTKVRPSRILSVVLISTQGYISLKDRLEAQYRLCQSYEFLLRSKGAHGTTNLQKFCHFDCEAQSYGTHDLHTAGSHYAYVSGHIW